MLQHMLKNVYKQKIENKNNIEKQLLENCHESFGWGWETIYI